MIDDFGASALWRRPLVLTGVVALVACSSMVAGACLAAAKPQVAAAVHPDLSGVWHTTGDFESASTALPAGGDSVGWAPLSRGLPEDRLKARPSKAERDAATLKAHHQIELLAQQDEKARIGDPAAAPLPGATPAGQAAYKELNKTYNIKYHNEHCYAGNIISGVTSGGMAISQKSDRIIMAYESGFPRIIYTDGRNDSEAFESMFGFSVGHWEGDTLVVKTTKISGKFIGVGLRTGWPMSDKITLTEYYKYDKTKKTMLVKRVFEDPVYYSEPLGSAEIVERTNEDMVISPCVESLADSPFAAQAAEVDKRMAASPK